MPAIDTYTAFRKIDDETWARVLQFVNWRTALEAEKVALTLEQTIQTLLQSGMTRAEIRTLLVNDLRNNGPVFADLNGGFKKAVNGGIQGVVQSVRAEIYPNSLPENQEYKWNLGHPASGKHCPSCIERAGRDPMTWGEWEAIGIPKAGATECGDYCYCSLDPVKA